MPALHFHSVFDYREIPAQFFCAKVLGPAPTGRRAWTPRVPGRSPRFSWGRRRRLHTSVALGKGLRAARGCTPGRAPRLPPLESGEDLCPGQAPTPQGCASAPVCPLGAERCVPPFPGRPAGLRCPRPAPAQAVRCLSWRSPRDANPARAVCSYTIDPGPAPGLSLVLTLRSPPSAQSQEPRLGPCHPPRGEHSAPGSGGAGLARGRQELPAAEGRWARRWLAALLRSPQLPARGRGWAACSAAGALMPQSRGAPASVLPLGAEACLLPGLAWGWHRGGTPRPCCSLSQLVPRAPRLLPGPGRQALSPPAFLRHVGLLPRGSVHDPCSPPRAAFSSASPLGGRVQSPPVPAAPSLVHIVDYCVCCGQAPELGSARASCTGTPSRHVAWLQV